MNTKVKSSLYIVYFLALVFVGDRLISYALSKAIVSKSNMRYSKLYKGEASCDILLIGNSRALPFYQPFIENITHKSTFNLSYNGMPTNLATVLLEDYLKHNGTPGLAIIEVTMQAKRKELVSTFGCFSEHSPGINKLIYEESSWTGIFNDILHLTRYNGEVFQRCAYYMNQNDTTWINDRVISQRDIDDEVVELEMFKFDEEAFKGYNDLISICEKNEIPYKLVITPYLPQYHATIRNFNDIKEQMSTYMKRPIYDFSTSVKSDEFFADKFHVNKRGSKEMVEIFFREGMFETGK